MRGSLHSDAILENSEEDFIRADFTPQKDNFIFAKSVATEGEKTKTRYGKNVFNDD